MRLAPIVLMIAALLEPQALRAQSGVPVAGVPHVVPADLRPYLPVGQLAGRARLSVWGFQVYDAALWVAPGFNANAFENHAFALELVYLRRFASLEITKRSLIEMTRQGPLPSDQVADWERQLQDVIPDVQAGDRLAGIYQPGVGAKFLLNGKLHKSLTDVQLTKRFFGIWLSAATSEPAMRRELVSQVNP